MADVQSNLPQIEVLLDRISGGFDFTSPGLERQLGREMADVVADGIADRSIQEQGDPAGNPWAALNEQYRSDKIRKGYPDLIGVRTGEMLSRVQLAGQVDIVPGTVTITYGAAESAKTKAKWFSQRRPFWGLDGRIIAELNVHARGALKVWIDRVREAVR